MGMSLAQDGSAVNGGNTTLSSIVTAFPTGVLKGDLCILFGVSAAAGTVAAKASAGWTSFRQDDVTTAGLGRMYMFTHTYAEGDTPPTITHTGATETVWTMVVLRSDTANAATLIASMTAAVTITAVAALNIPFASFASGTYDLKLGFAGEASGVQSTITPPTQSVSDGNPWKRSFFSLFKQTAGGATPVSELWDAQTPTAQDSATSSWTSNNSIKSASYAINISDGSSRNGVMCDCIEDDLFFCEAPIYAVSEEGDEALSAAAGVFGGGATLL